MYLRQSTASQELALGPFVDETDGKTAETGLTIANTDIKLHKAGGTTLTNKASGGATHISGGIYYAVLDASDTDTLGNLRVFVHVSGALPVVVQAVVLTANVYDSLVAGSDLLDANVSQFGGTNGTFASGRPEVNTTHAAGTAWGSGAITAASIATGAIDADALAADASTEINAGVLAVLGALADAAADGDPTTGDTVMQYVKQLVNVLVGSAGIVSWPSGAAPANAVSLAEGIRYIYDQIGVAGAGLTAADDAVMTRLGTPAGASVSADIADVEGKVDDLETRLGTPSDLGSGATVAANLVDIEGFADNLTGIETKIDTIDGIVDSILVDTAEIGAAGAGLSAVPWNAAWDAQVQSEVEDGLDVQLADSVPADGTRPTLRQALYMLYQYMTEREVAGTTVTINKSDGSTALFTLALDDGTTPTAISRAT